MGEPLDDESTEVVRNWVQGINLSKPIRNFGRDFSDGVLMAELIAHFLPRYVTLSNFTHVNSTALKRYNWETLQKVVFRHLHFSLSSDQIQALSTGNDSQLVEWVLYKLRNCIEEAIQNGRFRPSTRRSRSTASSRGGSTLNLSQIEDDRNFKQSINGHIINSARDKRADDCIPSTITSHQNIYQTANNVALNQNPNRPLVLEDFTKDQLIEKLYLRIRQLERNISQKDDKIFELTQKVEKLVQVICQHENEMGQEEVSFNSPPSTPSCMTDYFCNDEHKMDEKLRHFKQHGRSELLEALKAIDFSGI